MAWQLFRLTYELLSPLHVGYHKVGNVQRTRYYVLARTLWGAVTERLTRRGFQTQDVPQGDYQRIGAWVKTHCRFSSFFICQGNDLLTPRQQDNRLHYGDLPQPEFERRYLHSHVATALESATNSAQEGSLHEMEFIAPYYRLKQGNDEKVERTRLSGWVILDDDAAGVLGDEEKWRQWLRDLQVGGERRYGFGRMRLLRLETDSALNGISVEPDPPSPRVRLEAGTALPAHVVAQGIQACGSIEPLVGRETVHSHAFGSILTDGIVCWAPGSILTADARVILDQEGYWQPIAKG